MTDTTYSKLKKNNGDIVLLKCDWTLNSINLIIIDGSNAWKSYVDEAGMTEYILKYHVTFNEYFENLRQYVTDESLNEITVKIENNSFGIYKSLNFTFEYFCCPIEKIDYHTCISAIIDHLVSNKINLEARVNKLEKQNLELAEENKKFECKLKETKRLQEKDEKKLYASFILLLNEKKKRIQFLTETLESFKANKWEDLQLKVKEIDVLRDNKPNKWLEEVSDTDEETDNDTDEKQDDVLINERSPTQVQDLIQPSTSYEQIILPKKKSTLVTDVVLNKRRKVVEEKPEKVAVCNKDIIQPHSPVLEINSEDF